MILWGATDPIAAMVDKMLKILLVGNGTYSNRGCEAIVRGTMEILRQVFTDGIQATLATFGPVERVARQAHAETDAAITHVALGSAELQRGSWGWLIRAVYILTHPCQNRRYLTTPRNFPALAAAAADADIALAVGGDNYSLDYGWPTAYLALTQYLARRGVPVVLWGASVGPFDDAPATAQNEMFRHLSEMPAIMARESITLEYLRQHVNTTLYHVCDPAFMMPARSPVKFDCAPGSIGLNFSPLLAKYVANGNYEHYIRMCVEIIARLSVACQRPIALIPHVTSDTSAEDDFTLNQRIYQRLDTQTQTQVSCIPGNMTAAEYKGVISQCVLFAGARTHATIAAISSGVPTVSLAYSVKAFGINRDVFGSQEYCVAPGDWEHPAEVAAHIQTVLQKSDEIRAHLQTILPELRQRAISAGYALRDLPKKPKEDAAHAAYKI